MDLIKFVLLKFSQNYKNIEEKPKSILYYILVLFLIIFFTVGSSNVLILIQDGVFSLEKDLFIYFLYLILCMILISSVFVPYYSPLVNIISEYHPVKKYKKVLFNLFNDYTSVNMFSILIFLCFVTLYSKIFNFKDFIEGVFIISSCRIFIRIMQLIVEFHIKLNVKRVIDLFLILLLSLIILSLKLPLLIKVFVAFSSLIVSSFIIESEYKERRIRSKRIRITEINNNTLLRSFLNNIAFRVSLFMAIGLKIVVLSLDTSRKLIENKSMFDNDYIIWLFLSPLLMFVFIFNNFWGYFRNIWAKIYLVNPKTHYFILFYLKSISVPLIADFILSFIYIVIDPTHTYSSILLYLNIAVFLFITGFLYSIYQPIYIRKKIMLKQSTSPFSSFTSILILSSFYFIFKTLNYTSFFIISSFVEVILIVMFIYLTRNKHSLSLYDKLYKS